MNHPESRLHVVWLGHVVCIRSFQESRDESVQKKLTSKKEEEAKIAKEEAVLDAVTKDYAEFTIKEAYVEEVEGTKTYKVVLTDAEDNTAAVLYTEKGEVLE